MSILKKLLFLSVSAFTLTVRYNYPIPTENKIQDVESTSEVAIVSNTTNDFIENYIQNIDHPDFNYLATYEGSAAFSNVIARLQNRIYIGNAYTYVINITYFDDEGMHKGNAKYVLEIIVDSYTDEIGIIHVDKEINLCD